MAADELLFPCLCQSLAIEVAISSLLWSPGSVISTGGLELSPAEHGAAERLEAWHFCSGLDLAMPGCDTPSRTLNLYDGQNLIKKPHNLTLTFVFFIETTATVCVHSMCAQYV